MTSRALEALTGLDLVDAHMHQWDPFTTPRQVSGPAKLVRRAPFLEPLLLRLFPSRDREFIGDPTYVLNRYLPTDHRDDTNGYRVGTVVHIEAAWADRAPLACVDETRWVTGLPWDRDGAPELGALVVEADLLGTHVADELDAHLEASPLVRGVRFIATHHPDRGVRSWAETSGAYADPLLLQNFASIADRGLTFDLWAYSHQLADALQLITAYPGTTFVLDHLATPVGALGPRGRSTGTTEQDRRELLARWRTDLAAIAEQPNVVAKLSGTGMGLLGPGTDRDDQATWWSDRVALLRHVVDLFGEDRVLWGSNFPIDKPGMSMPRTIEAAYEALGDSPTPATVRAVFADNARRVYRIT